MLDIFDPIEISKVILIVNNLVYRNKLKTNKELNVDLKNTLKSCFVDFFGEHHREKITSKIDQMGIYRCFQIWGTRNSVSQLLLEEKAKLFNKNRKIKLSHLELLEYFANTDIDKVFDVALIESDVAGGLNELCQYFEIAIEDFNQPDVRQKFQTSVQELFQEFQKAPYYEDPEKNVQMLFLEKYVEKYKKYIKTRCALIGKDMNFYKDNVDFIYREDPVFAQLTQGLPQFWPDIVAKDLFERDSRIVAFQLYGNVFLGINPETNTIFHESFHVLSFNSDTNTTGFCYRKNHQYFNEAVTEFYSQMIADKFLALNPEGLTINKNSITTPYETRVFDYIEPFLKAFAPEIKEVLMRDLPIDDLRFIIGEEQFNFISECCEKVFKQNDADCLGTGDGAGINLLNKTCSIRRKKPVIERLLNAVSFNAEKMSNIIKYVDIVRLNKLANAGYSLSGKINKHTQQKVRDYLGQDYEDCSVEQCAEVPPWEESEM